MRFAELTKFREKELAKSSKGRAKLKKKAQAVGYTSLCTHKIANMAPEDLVIFRAQATADSKKGDAKRKRGLVSGAEHSCYVRHEGEWCGTQRL